MAKELGDDVARKERLDVENGEVVRKTDDEKDDENDE